MFPYQLHGNTKVVYPPSKLPSAPYCSVFSLKKTGLGGCEFLCVGRLMFRNLQGVDIQTAHFYCRAICTFQPGSQFNMGSELACDENMDAAIIARTVPSYKHLSGALKKGRRTACEICNLDIVLNNSIRACQPLKVKTTQSNILMYLNPHLISNLLQIQGHSYDGIGLHIVVSAHACYTSEPCQSLCMPYKYRSIDHARLDQMALERRARGVPSCGVPIHPLCRPWSGV